MAFIKRPTAWANGDDVVPSDLQRYEDALDDHETSKANSSGVGVLSTLKTTAKVIVNAINELFDNTALKLNKSDVVNNLTTTDATKALAAPQGKALADQITVSLDALALLNTTRGYKSTVQTPNSTDFNTIIENGNYWCNAWVHTNIPILADGTRINGVCVVRKDADGNVFQDIKATNGMLLSRKRVTGVWDTKWKDIATTDKTEIPFPFNSGYVQANADYGCKIVKSNLKQSIIYCGVKKSDGTNFTAGAEHVIGVLPAGFLPPFYSQGDARPAYPEGQFVSGNCRIAIFGGGVYAATSVACPAIFFTLPYEIGG